MKNSNLFSKKNFNLLKEFTIAKFKRKDQATFFGFLWSFFSPLIMTNILFFLFKNQIGQAFNINFFLYILIGAVNWNFFVVATGFGITAIFSNGMMVKNVAFPKELVIFSDLLVYTIEYFLELALIFLFMFFTGNGISWHVIFLLPLIFMEILLIAGAMFFLSCIYVIYARDLNHVWNMATRMLFFLVPVFYPLSMVPPNMKWFVLANPMTQIIIFSRDVLLYHRVPTLSHFMIIFCLCAVFFMMGYSFFKRHEFKMVETV
ncbi:MAG TPA: ABC transporter permease [Candidatus Omnitrophota bacterium]|nr:ABC transporter permease [Candidatus Omnitrophota bacterium]